MSHAGQSHEVRSPGDLRIVLASGSRYRAQLMADAGIPVVIDPADVDERALDHRFDELGADGFALELAELKALTVAPRHPGRIVVAGDQVGVVTTSGAPRLLTKQPTVAGAIDQLMMLSGTTHHLVNGLVVLAPDGRLVSGIDIQRITMRPFDRAEAAAYVERFEPFDTSGSYRLEDQELMALGEGFITEVQGEDDTGVVGLPVPLLRRLLADVTSGP